MPLQLKIQFDIILYGVLAGQLMGTIFDLYRLFRGAQVAKAIIIVEDILFCILCAILVFLFLLYMNYAFLGPYVYLFIFISLVLYFRFISSHILFIERYLNKAIYKIFRILIKNISYPIKLFLSKTRIKNK